MNLNHVETFHYFCMFMNMSRTAEHLHISQPAVSQQLRNFQLECGVPLFYREAQTYKLTETGEAMFLLSKRIFLRIDQMEEMLAKTRESTAETLKIGITKSYARIVMPELIAKFQQKYPRMHVRLSEGNSADLICRVRSGKEDIVVVARSDFGASLKAIPFGKAEFVLVARPDHPLARKVQVSMKSLSGEPMVIRERGSGSRNAILGTLRKFEVTPSVLVESESLSFILGYIERKMGVAFILSHEIQDELAKGLLKRINLVEGTIGFFADIVMRRNEPTSLPMEYFLEILKKYGETSFAE
ncbi:MAG TPA: LysR family transcriptional regulator [Desulfomonilaceae bacterium]|nr:LysR family transcriptional regulator [Desulfomonilaceae bacterium]